MTHLLPFPCDAEHSSGYGDIPCSPTSLVGQEPAAADAAGQLLPVEHRAELHRWGLLLQRCSVVHWCAARAPWSPEPFAVAVVDAAA